MAEDVRINNETEDKGSLDEFKIEVEPIGFDSIIDSKFIFARDFGEIVSNIFRNVFVDWEGCRVSEVKGSPFISLDFFFNHNEFPESGSRVRAITRNTNTETKNATLDGIRKINNVMSNGDRYYLTEAAKKAFEPFLFDNIGGLRGQQGKVNWKRAVSEVADNTQRMYVQVPTQQYTQVSFIDPSKLAALIYGEDDVDGGAKWCYQVMIASYAAPVNQYGIAAPADPASRVLRIDRVSSTELNDLATKLGFSNIGNRLNIIR